MLNTDKISNVTTPCLILGYFKTEIEAFNAYKIAKEAFVKEQANKWKSEIDIRAYEALMSYEVSIDD